MKLPDHPDQGEQVQVTPTEHAPKNRTAKTGLFATLRALLHLSGRGKPAAGAHGWAGQVTALLEQEPLTSAPPTSPASKRPAEAGRLQNPWEVGSTDAPGIALAIIAPPEGIEPSLPKVRSRGPASTGGGNRRSRGAQSLTLATNPSRAAVTAASTRGGLTLSAAHGLTAVPAHNVPRSAGRAASLPFRRPSTSSRQFALPTYMRQFLEVNAPSVFHTSRTTAPASSSTSTTTKESNR